MEAEQPRRGVRATQPVDDAAEGVQHAAGHDEAEHQRPAGTVERLDVEDRHPAQADVDRRRQPARRRHPADLEDDPGRRADPHDGQQRAGLAAGQQRHRECGVRPRDDEKDVRVVEPLEEPVRRRPPAAPVVERGGAEEQRRGRDEDRDADAAPFGRRGGDEREAGEDDQRERGRVQPAPQPRADRIDDLGGRLDRRAQAPVAQVLHGLPGVRAHPVEGLVLLAGPLRSVGPGVRRGVASVADHDSRLTYATVG